MPFKNVYDVEIALNHLIKTDNNCTIHCNYKYLENECQMDLVTYNPVHSKSFLLHTMTAENQLDVANKMYDHVWNLNRILKQKKDTYVNYTVEWRDKTEEKNHLSHFYGNDLDDILKKFYYGKNRDTLIIFHIRLNPIS